MTTDNYMLLSSWPLSNITCSPEVWKPAAVAIALWRRCSVLDATATEQTGIHASVIDGLVVYKGSRRPNYSQKRSYNGHLKNKKEKKRKANKNLEWWHTISTREGTSIKGLEKHKILETRNVKTILIMSNLQLYVTWHKKYIKVKMS